MAHNDILTKCIELENKFKQDVAAYQQEVDKKQLEMFEDFSNKIGDIVTGCSIDDIAKILDAPELQGDKKLGDLIITEWCMRRDDEVPTFPMVLTMAALIWQHSCK